MIICPHWLLAWQPSQNGPMIVNPYAPGHSSLLLKSPPRLQWRLSPFTYFLSPSALSPLLLTSLYSLILSPSLPSSSFSTLFTTFTSSLHLLPHVHLFLCLSHSSPRLVLRVQQQLCRLEFVGLREKVVFIYSFCECVCWTGREGRQHPTPDQHFIQKCGDLGTDLLLQRFLSYLSAFLIATPGMPNVDWWMFPNFAFLTLSATTTSRCLFSHIYVNLLFMFMSAIVPVLGQIIGFIGSLHLCLSKRRDNKSTIL